MKKLTIYILKEQFFPFLTGFVFFSFIFIMQQIFTLADLFINRDIGLVVILKFFLILFPTTMSKTIPISVLFSSIRAIGRLSNDSEIIALKAAGISFFRIIRPVIFSGIIMFILMAVFYETLLVYSYRNQIELAVSNPAILLEEGVFKDIGNRTLWVEKYNGKTHELENILLFGKNNNRTWDIISAESGELVDNKDGSKSMKLCSGKFYTGRPENFTFSVVDFTNGSAEMLLSAKKLNTASNEDLDPNKYTSINLYKALKQIKKSYKEDSGVARNWVNFYEKMAIPFSCFVFALVGAPLGVSYRRNARGMGFGISIIVILVYFVLFSGGQSLATRGHLHPFFGVWIANFVLLLAGIFVIIFKEKSS